MAAASAARPMALHVRCSLAAGACGPEACREGPLRRAPPALPPQPGDWSAWPRQGHRRVWAPAVPRLQGSSASTQACAASGRIPKPGPGTSPGYNLQPITHYTPVLFSPLPASRPSPPPGHLHLRGASPQSPPPALLRLPLAAQRNGHHQASIHLGPLQDPRVRGGASSAHWAWRATDGVPSVPPQRSERATAGSISAIYLGSMPVASSPGLPAPPVADRLPRC